MSTFLLTTPTALCAILDWSLVVILERLARIKTGRVCRPVFALRLLQAQRINSTEG